MDETRNESQVFTTFPNSGNWSREQLKLVFYLYCQIPFGKLHSKNSEVIQLAALIGRSPNSTAMKLVNFASLDPAITSTGRKGLGKVSQLDREIWDTFHADWEKLTLECEELKRQRQGLLGKLDDAATTSSEPPQDDDYSGETRDYIARYRIKQGFFRRAVFSNYRGRCCISGVSESRLLVASHIVPWSVDRANRLNPRNGLCLSAIHDKAFDNGLITISNDYRVILSDKIIRCRDDFIRTLFFPIADKEIEGPERFAPSPEFLTFHQNNVFLGRKSN